MACNTETKQIGDHEYSVTQWPATKSMLLKFKLAKAFGASLAALASQSETDEAEVLSDSLSTLFQNNSPEDLVNLMKECVIGAARDGKRIVESSFDELFSGDNLLEVYQIFVFVIKVNYGNLMTGQLASNLLAKTNLNL